jgi:uncharacterized protein YigE (DUF2233 family)
MNQRLSRRALLRRILILPLLSLPACGTSTREPAPSILTETQSLPTLLPTLPVELPVLPTPAPAPAPPEDSGWIAGAGLELRRLRRSSAAGSLDLSIVRLDPAQVRFQVGYEPDPPLALPAWQSLSGAQAIINGGFFDEQYRSTALLISDGRPVGESYVGRGGMFAVDTNGAVSLRYLAEQPYDPNESLVEAIQGWPMLIRDGTPIYGFEDGKRARRSVIALDQAGRVLLLASATSSFTLAELAAWLAESDLDIDAALNLDGGSSTGLMVRAGDLRERIDAFVPLPIVLMVLQE